MIGNLPERDAPDAAPERRGIERRHDSDRRTLIARTIDGVRAPSYPEQRTQYVMRLVFALIVFGYFNWALPAGASRLPTMVIDGVLGAFVLLHLAGWWHTRRVLQSPRRWRLTMWLDLIMTAAMSAADPVVPSPGFLVFIVVLLGNGMRYGLRFFAEAAIGCFVLAMLLFAIRFEDYLWPLKPSNALFMLFGALLLLYSYLLMARAERSRRQLEFERGVDPLTGLLNRRAFLERAEPLFAGPGTPGGPLVVMFADLDGFKAINDRLGHHVGDQVLAAVARALASVVRSHDLIARYGGDEFVLLLPETDIDQATVVARRLQARMQEWSAQSGVAVSLSIGLGQFPQPGCDFPTALVRVDEAMYHNKQTRGGGGIHRAVITPS
ncbi:MAG: diguanylate cyclase [Pseudomonadota bacterium]